MDSDWSGGVAYGHDPLFEGFDLRPRGNICQAIRPVSDGRTLSQPESEKVRVYDFFSGCGGTSAGLREAGMRPVLAVDVDGEALRTYAANFPAAVALKDDIRNIHTRVLEGYLERDRKGPVLFSACAPCQPFSKQNRQRKPADDRASLLQEFVRFLRRFRPDLVFIENVPGIQNQVDGPFEELRATLDVLGYHQQSKIVNAQDYGVAQNRVRLVLLASAFGPVSVPDPTHGVGRKRLRTVRDMIAHLPMLDAGTADATVRNHYACALSPMNLRRVRSVREGGGRVAWEENLRLACHKGVKGYTDVYGRMQWDKPAPALTTRCVSLSNGRYGHPEQDRAISLREAASLQSFDEEFSFVGTVNGIARQIGNAVPPALATACGMSLIESIKDHVDAWHG